MRSIQTVYGELRAGDTIVNAHEQVRVRSIEGIDIDGGRVRVHRVGGATTIEPSNRVVARLADRHGEVPA